MVLSKIRERLGLDQLKALTRSGEWTSYPDPRQSQNTQTAQSVAWLTSEWTPGKGLSAALALAGLAALCLVFWKRSLVYGLAVLTTLAVGKMVWGVVEGRGTGWAMLVPALTGLAICNGAVLVALRRLRASRRAAASATTTTATHPTTQEVP